MSIVRAGLTTRPHTIRTPYGLVNSNIKVLLSSVLRNQCEVSVAPLSDFLHQAPVAFVADQNITQALMRIVEEAQERLTLVFRTITSGLASRMK